MSLLVTLANIINSWMEKKNPQKIYRLKLIHNPAGIQTRQAADMDVTFTPCQPSFMLALCHKE